MKLRELVNKIDNDIVLWIVRDEDNKTVFRKERTYDVIPKDLMDMEVGGVFSSFNRLYIYVKRNCSFRELLDRIHGYEYIDVYVVNCDGTKENEKFFVGDKVFSLNFGFGVVENILDDKGNPYPVAVRWSDDSKYPNTFSYFSENGVYDVQDEDPKLDIHPLSNVLDKKTEDAINPSHYKVKSLPEAIDIINHLMHREQYEGFLWGNILKYAYRFGHKGDKAETAGKIAWYANKLKELEKGGNNRMITIMRKGNQAVQITTAKSSDLHRALEYITLVIVADGHGRFMLKANERYSESKDTDAIRNHKNIVKRYKLQGFKVTKE